MTIRARLTLSFLAVLALFAFNLVFSFWSDAKRESSFEDLRRAIQRQNLISAIEQELNNCEKQVTLISQIMTDSIARPASADAISQFNGRLDSVSEMIHRMSLLSAGESRRRIESFGAAFQDLSNSWRIFYKNLGHNQSVAVEEEVMRSEPLSQRVIHELLPELQESEKEMVEAGSAHFYGTARLTTRITVLIFGVSGLLACLLAWRV